MAAILYTIVGITASASLHCAERREISPCTCLPGQNNTIKVTCEGMDSFKDVINALSGRFNPDMEIKLYLTFSKLLDMENRMFSEMNMNVKHLRMNFDDFGRLSESSFRNMSRITYLSLADSDIRTIPPGLMGHMPNIETLDLGKTKLKHLKKDDLKGLRSLEHLVMAQNDIQRIEKGTFPPSLRSLHIGKNQLTTLNGTVRDLTNLRLLFINSNNLTTLEGELPEGSENLFMIMAMDNELESLPESLKTLHLDTIFLSENRLVTLNRTFAQSKKLKSVYAEDNRLAYLARDEFAGAEIMDELNMHGNQLTSFNGSLLPMKKLRMANFSCNQLTEFSLAEIQGLVKLRKLVLSKNQISRLVGFGANAEPAVNKYALAQLLLDNNLLESLDEALKGFSRLAILNLTNNRLKTLLPNDFQGMEELLQLDLSFNHLITIQELSKAYLPTLELFNVSNNQITQLTNEFQGMPVLCTVDLSDNKIEYMSSELVANTRCRNHGVVHSKLEIILQENPILCNENVSLLAAEMELQLARIRGMAHCVIPQEFTITQPILLTPHQQNLPVVVGQSPVQLSGTPAVVQVLVPSNQIIPNQIPALIPSNVGHAPPQVQKPSPPAALISATEAPQEEIPPATVVNPVQDSVPVVVEAKTISSYILEATTKAPAVATETPLIIIDEATNAELPPDELPILPESPPAAAAEVELNPVFVAIEDPNMASEIDENELLSHGFPGVPVPEVIMPPVGESSNRKLDPHEDPPEMLHDQEMPPVPTRNVGV